MKDVHQKIEDTQDKPNSSMERSRFNYSRFFRWAIVLVLYLIVFSLLDRLTRILELFPGVVAWYLPDGLSLAFLLTFGVGFVPALFVASLISSLLIFQFSTPIYPF